jgi:hypothetical protein
VELYDVQAGATVRTLRGGSGTESLERAAGRMAIELSAAIAQLHGRRFPPAYVREDTHSPVALAHLLEGQSRFWNAEIDAAAEAYGRAIAADSAFGAAYARLSAVESWGTRWDHAAARRVADTGLRQRNRLAPRWIEVLEARRHYAMREIDAAVQAFDRMKVNHADLADAWFGLSESVFELSAFHGHDPRNARAAFDRLVALDSTFAPIYHRLVMLALWDGDTAAARRYHRRMPPRFPDRDAYGYLVELWSDPAGSGAVLQQLGRADTRTISIVIGELSRDDRMLPLIDTIAGFLLNTRRSADDRVRGAHYRMLATAGTPRWDETLRLLDNAGGAAFDEWIVFAALAGYDVGGRADRFLSRADSLLDAGDLPDFSRWPNDDAQRRFQALVHRASLTGDSAHATRLARLLERAAVTADASNPLPDALRGSLEARLALLAADTGRAIRSLDHALARVLYPWWFYPIYAMAPQRLLLAELLRARGQRLEADRWLQSFSTSGFVGDGLYRRRQSAIAGAVRRSHAANLPHSPGGRNGSEPER